MTPSPLQDRISGMSILRPVRAEDVDQIVALGLHAWEPVFTSMLETVGPTLFRALFTDDWRRYQETDIRRAVSEYLVTVADERDRVVGYVAVDLPRTRLMARSTCWPSIPPSSVSASGHDSPTMPSTRSGRPAGRW
jgi:hypothetical protein